MPEIVIPPHVRKNQDSPFTTTSDVLQYLNTILEKQQSQSNENKPQFQLQRRLDDGSTRPVTGREQKAADMESKLKQVAHHVSQLKSQQERFEWAEVQRTYGNTLVKRGDYEEALDVYVTCMLVAKEDRLLFIKCINNLAHAALLLRWYGKAEQFCTMAIQELKLDMNDSAVGNTDHPEQVSKLFYKRGKARRLRGNYQQARADLQLAQEWLNNNDTAELKAIQKELRNVAQSAAKGRNNETRARQAMQRAFTTATASHHQQQQQQCSSDADDSSITAKVVLHEKRNRQYSTLRAPLPKDSDDDDASSLDEEQQRPELSYWQWYLAVVGRIAERLLLVLGDDEYPYERKQHDD
jgi:hypothetical protein